MPGSLVHIATLDGPVSLGSGATLPTLLGTTRCALVRLGSLLPLFRR